MIKAPRIKRICAWLLAATSVLLAVLYFLNVPFYSGSSLGSHFAWRMEHGRMGVRVAPFSLHEQFYIAPNSEGLKFLPESHWWAWNDWNFHLPLWMPLGASVLGSAGLFYVTRRGRRAGVCGKCGYDLRGLAAGAKCPECGEGNKNGR